MKKAVICFFILVLATVGCSKASDAIDSVSDSADSASSAVPGYADMANVLNDYTDIQEKYLKDLKNVDSPEDLIKALETYTESMTKIMPRMQELSEKYPELAEVEPPKHIQERLDKIADEIQEEAPKAVMEYQSDPKVQEAFMKMASMMGQSMEETEDEE